MNESEKIKLFNSIIENYSEYVYNMIYYTILDEEDAKDLTQEVFYKIWKGLDSFRNESSLKTWIFRITQNHLKNYLKSKKIKKILSLEFLFEEKNRDFESKDYYLSQRIESLLSRLPEDYRRVLVLFYIDGFNIKEISEILGTKEGTIKSKLHRAREKLKSLIMRFGYES
ncbi:MAG: RNA polymerase sigma factor [Candidatus Hydrothermia bacterium]|jgi:RNA polymerase sigma-70 factor (ECF subfamily)|nr:RNA polymerase sigma factor [Candidatus Hydrothermia bacterium]